MPLPHLHSQPELPLPLPSSFLSPSSPFPCPRPPTWTHFSTEQGRQDEHTLFPPHQPHQPTEQTQQPGTLGAGSMVGLYIQSGSFFQRTAGQESSGNLLPSHRTPPPGHPARPSTSCRAPAAALLPRVVKLRPGFCQTPPIPKATGPCGGERGWGGGRRILQIFSQPPKGLQRAGYIKFLF